LWQHVGNTENFFPALLTANFAFLAFLPVAALSYHYFEKRFLVYRKPYLRAPVSQAAATAR